MKTKNRSLLAVGFSLVAMLMCGQVEAGQSGESVCTRYVSQGDNGDVCVEVEIRVHITTDGDVGKPGAFAIGVQTTDGRIGLWTADQGFVAPHGGLETPADGFFAALPASRDYVVYRGSPEGVCQQSGGNDFNLWAGHGALQADKAAWIADVQGKMSRSTIPAIQAKLVDNLNHMKAMAIQSDGRGDTTHAAKGGIVYSQACNSRNNSN